jgi:hypothetical protein
VNNSNGFLQPTQNTLTNTAAATDSTFITPTGPATTQTAITADAQTVQTNLVNQPVFYTN